MPVSVIEMVIAALVTFVAAGVQGAIGFGIAVVSVPILALLDPALAPVPQALLSYPIALTLLWRDRSSIDLSGMGWLLLGRLPGAAIGALLLVSFDTDALTIVVALMVLAAVIALGSGWTLVKTPTTSFFTGVVSSISSLVASIGGPPMALLYRGETGPTIRATLSAIFVIGLSITIAIRALTGRILAVELESTLWLIAPMLLGLVVGLRLQSRIEGERLRRAVLVVAGLAAVGLLANQIVG